MAVLICSIPFVTFAQQNSLQAEAIAAAERDARNDVNKGLWFLGGCFGGVIGVIIAYSVEPSPPAIRLLGKSPEYVAFYTQAYAKKAKKLQTNSALGGCCVSILYVAIYGFMQEGAHSSDYLD